MLEPYTVCKCGGDAKAMASSRAGKLYTIISVCEKCACSIKDIYIFEHAKTEYLDKN